MQATQRTGVTTLRRRLVIAIVTTGFVAGLAGIAGPAHAEDGICGGIGQWDPVLQDCV